MVGGEEKQTISMLTMSNCCLHPSFQDVEVVLRAIEQELYTLLPRVGIARHHLLYINQIPHPRRHHHHH